MGWLEPDGHRTNILFVLPLELLYLCVPVGHFADVEVAGTGNQQEEGLQAEEEEGERVEGGGWVGRCRGGRDGGGGAGRYRGEGGVEGGWRDIWRKGQGGEGAVILFFLTVFCLCEK